MFEKLVLTDYQNHQKLVVRLSPAITSVVGLSDAGKTAVLRALGAVCLNKPADQGMVRDGRKSFTVRLKCDGKWVTRKRGKRTNVYLVGKKKFTAFGTAVPEEVRQLLNVDDGNFQKQLDKHFWFGDTGGQVSKRLNEIVNLELIDTALARLASEVRSAKAEEEHTTGRFRQARQEKKALRRAVEFARDVEALAQLDSDHSAILAKTGRLSILIAELRQTAMTHRIASESTLEGEKVLALFRPYKRLDRKCRKLERLIADLEKAERQVAVEIPDLTELTKVRQEGDKVAKRVYDLEDLIDQITKLEDEACQAERKLSVALGRLKSLRKKGGVCPTCGRPLPRSSRPSSPTSTCRTKHHSPGPRRKTGRTSSSATSPNSGSSATDTIVPW